MLLTSILLAVLTVFISLFPLVSGTISMSLYDFMYLVENGNWSTKNHKNKLGCSQACFYD